MRFISIGMEENLNRTVLELAKDNCILVFPTRISASLAARSFACHWDLKSRLLLSVEDLQEALILPDSPVLTDEKRLLCLYLVMGEEQREFFHILSYSDIVDWGKRFFDFFEEMADECVSMQTLGELGNSGTMHLQEWQEIYLDRIITIRDDYYQYISALGFSDPIFCKKVENIVVPWKGYDIVYVNQYYYTALEKAQIRALEESGNNVIILTQALQIKQSDGTWKMQDFNLEKAWEELCEKPAIETIETLDETQMALAFLAWQKDMHTTNNAIIDSSFHAKSYSRYFAGETFAQTANYPFCESGIYQMLTALAKGMEAINSNGGFLPIKMFSRLVSAPWFLRYFLDGQVADLHLACTSVKQELEKLLANNYLYVDKALLLEMQETHLKQVLTQFMDLLDAFNSVDSIERLCAVFDEPQGLKLERLISSQEKERTDILSCFWERLANFFAIEQLSLISSWHQVFGTQLLGQNLLELLLSYLKTGTVRYHVATSEHPQWEISNLLDSRNRSFDTVAVFQIIEGLLPSSPTPVWLFSEAQRARLGLKTYQDIRAWERYYFFRLLLTSRHAVCFSYRNLERDITPSSFLGELQQLIQKQDSNSSITSTVQIPVGAVYSGSSSLSDAQNADYCCFDVPPPMDFFVIPCEPRVDFPKDVAAIGASGLIQLLKNPFLWYVEYFIKLQKLDWEAEETISPKLFGNLMHAYFAKILRELQGTHEGLEKLQALFGNRSHLEAELQKLIESPAFRYQIPKNYNADFLRDILAERLSESLLMFYEDWVKKHLDRRIFTLLPEADSLSEYEQGYKKLGDVMHEGTTFTVATRGKADLRIELENSAMIVDFKTGTHDNRQLALYEWFYYLLDETFPESAVSSLFWNILDPSKNTKGMDAKKRSELKVTILQTFLSVLDNGFYQGQKSADRTRGTAITRADLMAGKKELTNAEA